MTRDTFDAFTPPERGRFGDNEQADASARVRDDFVYVPLFKIRETPAAILFSVNGARGQREWIPKKLVDEPPSTQPVHPAGGEPCEHGRFGVAEFKLRNLGWLILADEKQGALL